MKKVMQKINLLWNVLNGNSIIMTRDKDKCLIVHTGNNSKKFVKEAATFFFREALLLDTK